MYLVILILLVCIVSSCFVATIFSDNDFLATISFCMAVTTLALCIWGFVSPQIADDKANGLVIGIGGFCSAFVLAFLSGTFLLRLLQRKPKK